MERLPEVLLHFRCCPKANDPAGKCDVVDDVTAERAEAMLMKPMYKDKVVVKRAARGMSAIIFKARANVHGWAADDDHEKCMEYLKMVDQPHRR